MRKKYILFDLDGTLTDPMVGITKSAQYALQKFGIKITDHKSLSFFIGPPLRDSFCQYYGMTQEEAGRAIQYYREYYTPIGIFENELYEGIEEMLIHLKKEGHTIVLATSKPEVFAKQIETGTTIIFGVSCPFAAALLVGDIFFGHLLQKIDWSRFFRFDIHL